ncbi:hypothetical protein C8Q75DRAFT_132158 [Abortiporus biennis]|nr:hypothetical protein C8Q75DRAFT_132158 [Abortiporus biennis]
MALRPRTLDARRGRRMAIYIRNSEDQEEITRHNFHVEDSSNPSSPTSHFIQSEELSSFQGEQQLLEKEKGTGCDHSSDCTKVGSGHTSSFGHTLGCSSPSVENEDTHEEECQATASASTSTIPIRIDPQVLEELAEAVRLSSKLNIEEYLIFSARDIKLKKLWSYMEEQRVTSLAIVRIAPISWYLPPRWHTTFISTTWHETKVIILVLSA